MIEEVVSAQWLKNNLALDNLIILDASPKRTINNQNSLHDGLCIPMARPFHIKGNFTNVESAFPNTMPSPSQFEEECQKLGINQNSEVVVYDNLGVYTSPRVWWLFKVMGHENVRVLDGGLPEWIKMGFETAEVYPSSPSYKRGDFKSDLQSEWIVSYDDVCENIDADAFLVVDARSQGRFEGRETEPRKNLQSGSIPKSVNIPYQSLLMDGKFMSLSAIRKIFEETVGDGGKLVFSCGSGMTACIVMLASEMAFKQSRFLFDGSWTEFATKRNLVVE